MEYFNGNQHYQQLSAKPNHGTQNDPKRKSIKQLAHSLNLLKLGFNLKRSNSLDMIQLIWRRFCMGRRGSPRVLVLDEAKQAPEFSFDLLRVIGTKRCF